VPAYWDTPGTGYWGARSGSLFGWLVNASLGDPGVRLTGVRAGAVQLVDDYDMGRASGARHWGVFGYWCRDCP